MTFKISVKETQGGFIAKTLDYSYIAQGPTKNEAVSCLMDCIKIQKQYDKSKGIKPWSLHKLNKGGIV